MNSLNELFQHILHSEQNFSDRLTRLRELNLQIEEAQRQLQVIQDSTESLQGQLVLKTQRLVDNEVECHVIKVKQTVLEEQKIQLEKKNQELKTQLEGILTDTEKERQMFLAEVVDFNKSYDLKGSGIKYREHQTQKQIELLQEEIALLETEFLEMESQQRKVEKAKKRLNDEEKALETETYKRDELKATLDSLKNERDELEKERQLLTERYNDDPDIRRLRQELEICRNSSEDADCRELKKELETLQRECYKKQMKFVQQKGASQSALPRKMYNLPLTTSDSWSIDDELEGEDLELDESELASLEAVETLNIDSDFDDDFDEFSTTHSFIHSDNTSRESTTDVRLNNQKYLMNKRQQPNPRYSQPDTSARQFRPNVDTNLRQLRSDANERQLSFQTSTRQLRSDTNERQSNSQTNTRQLWSDANERQSSSQTNTRQLRSDTYTDTIRKRPCHTDRSSQPIKPPGVQQSSKNNKKVRFCY